MRRTPVIAVSAVVLAAAPPRHGGRLPRSRASCAGEGAFVSGTAQQFGAGFGGIVSGTAQASGGLADVIAASHALNCAPRP